MLYGVAETSIVADGLKAPVRLLTDLHGLTHIYAECESDLYFAQGFNAARERLWQIDMWRRRGLGALAEAFGYGFVAQDRASRMFLYRGDMDAEWKAYPPGTKAACERFCEGINLYVARIIAGKAALPNEFVAMGIKPLHWSPDDIVRIRSNTLTTNAVSELQRCALRQQGRDVADRLRTILRPAPPEESKPCFVEDCDELIALMELAKAPVIITRERLDAKRSEIDDWRNPRHFMPLTTQAGDTGGREGSNNWALSGAKTASGYPILANDPHRALQNPALRYVVHLCCPAFSVIGGGEPALPGISIGHNGRVAFGLTICPADQEDVFRFECGSGDGPHPSLVEKVSLIAVRHGEPVEIRTYWYGASPVLRLDENGKGGVAVRTVWSEPGAAPYLGGLALSTVGSVAAFRSRLGTWRLPAVNYVAADTHGSIGWFVAGAIPVRRPGSGVVPEHRAGDPWYGFLTNDTLPTRIDPPNGYVMSANEYNLPSDWNDATPVSYEWYDDFRARRIHETLVSSSSATVQNSIELQGDATSTAAMDLLGRLRQSLGTSGQHVMSDSLQALLAWNGTIDNEAPETRFFHHWLSVELKPAIAAALGEREGPPADISTEAAVLALDGMPAAECARVMLASIRAAERFAATGALDRSPPRRALFRHAIQDGVHQGRTYHSGSIPWCGDDATVHFGKSGFDPGLIEVGASFRIVMDLSDWDLSRWQNIPDQSIGCGAASEVAIRHRPQGSRS